MSEKILITQKDDEARQRLCAMLKVEGYQPLEADNLELAIRMLHKFPALLLLEVELAAMEGPGPWNAFGQICKTAGIPCLLFSSRDQPAEKMQELAPWAAGTFQDPENCNEILLKVANQFTIHRLTYEFKLAQNLLLEKHMQLEKFLRSATHIQKSLEPSRFPRIGNLDLRQLRARQFGHNGARGTFVSRRCYKFIAVEIRSSQCKEQLATADGPRIRTHAVEDAVRALQRPMHRRGGG